MACSDHECCGWAKKRDPEDGAPNIASGVPILICNPRNKTEYNVDVVTPDSVHD